jgi:hypothetical protein
MSSDFYIPKWQKPEDDPPENLAKSPLPSAADREKPTVATDFHSLTKEPEPVFKALVTEQPRNKEVQRLDFHSLGGAKAWQPKVTPRRKFEDWIIDAVTPCLIFTMVLPVLLFLLDVRFVYTAVHDGNMRWVVICFLVAIVGINRIAARDGGGESYIYGALLAVVMGLYTVGTTTVWDVGSVSREFMNHTPWLATLFNMALVGVIWWVVNRLTHECCVDENSVAGDLGMFAGTARRFQQSMQKGGAPKKLKMRTISPLEEIQAPMFDLDPIDPTETRKAPEENAARTRKDAVKRLPKRHPGISIFYFFVPVFAIFTWGLGVIQHHGEYRIVWGWIYLFAYITSSLLLLMFSSLGGLREYYRSKKIAMPRGVAWFWMALGCVMVAMVLVGAMRMPLPSLPPIVHVDEHVIDPYGDRSGSFQLKEVDADPVALFEQSVFLERLSLFVLFVFAVFLLYALLKAALAGIAALGRHRHRFPPFVGRFFAFLEKTLSRLTSLPTLPKRRRRVRVQRDIATSVRYQNPMGFPERVQTMSVGDQVEYAYEALCALALDLGVPRDPHQTPYEFIDAFPEPLHTLRPEAENLTRLYLIAAYSTMKLEDRVLDQLRAFWITYNRVKQRVIR